jgi:tRNA threonylcarbamoyladenosine biosynthesis protein TsaB
VNILALDTAGRACSVALLAGGRVFQRFEASPQRHAATLLPLAEACLAEAGLGLAELDAVAFGRGPGSFTGLRIAASVAQGVAFAARLPVLPVSSLAAGAAAAWRLHGWRRVLVAYDARMGELYTAAFELDEGGRPQAVGPERLVAAQELAAPAGEGWRGAGSGFGAWPELAAALGLAAVDPALEPSAADLLGLAAAALERGEAVAADEALPVYLRERVAWQGGGRKSG